MSKITANDIEKSLNVVSFVCKVCKKSFKLKSKLKIHKTIHSGERSYKCEICSKSFIQRGHLTVHMLVHSGKKDF